MKDMKQTQEDRTRFLHALLDYASKSGSSDPYFYRDELMKTLGISEGEFNVLQNTLGNKYCAFVDYVDNRKRYKIYTGECWHLHDEFEEWAIHKDNAKTGEKLYKLTIALLVATIALLIVALPPAIDSLSKIDFHFRVDNRTNKITSEPNTYQKNNKANGDEPVKVKSPKP